MLRAGGPRAVHAVVELPDAEREGEGVRRPPVHLQDGGPGEGIGAGAGLLVQAHGVAVGRVGVLGAPVGRAGVLRPPGDQAQRLLQDQDVPPVQIEGGRRPGQGGPRGATGEKAAGIAPGVEGDGVARGAEGQVVQGLEGQGPPGDRLLPLLGREHRHRARLPGEDQGARTAWGLGAGAGQRRPIGGASRSDLEGDPGPGVGPVVHEVVHQPGVAPHRGPAPGGAQVGFGGHGILEVAQVVGRVGQRLHQGHPQVGRVALLPGRHGRRHAVEHQAPEGGEVPGQVVHPGHLRRRG